MPLATKCGFMNKSYSVQIEEAKTNDELQIVLSEQNVSDAVIGCGINKPILQPNYQ